MSFDLPVLPDGWHYSSVETCAKPNSISYGVVQPGSPVVGGVPIIRVNNFRDTGLDLSDVMRISPDIEAKYGRTRLGGGEVLLTLVGSVGQVAVVPEDMKGFNVARAVCVIHPLDQISPEWIALCLRSPLSQHLLGSRANTTVQTTINLKDVRALPIPIPPDTERKSITSTISALDDRITLLRETNATLEAIAQALFKSWFVDFDPVRSKQQGIAPEGMDEATAALFPDGFEESELGLVPRGWKVSTIGECLVTLLGGTPSRAKSEYWTEGTVPWINSGKVNEFRIIQPSEFITAQALEKSATKLLPKRTTVLAITGATLGQVSVTEIDCCANQSVIGIMASDNYPTEFIYPWICKNINKLIASQTGGAQQHINKGNVDELALLCPDQKIVKSYHKVVEPLFNKIATNCFQSQNLATLRDTLLPRLISGQLRLPEAEEQLEAAPA